MQKSKVLRLILSFVLAVGLWAYVINSVNPSSTTVVRNIPVTLVGTETLRENHLAIEGSGEYIVDLTVRASRTDLRTLSEDNFVATADVSGLTLGQDYITVEVDAPSGYIVEDIRSRKIQVYVDELEEKSVPVVVRYGPAAAGCEAAVVSIYPETVEIYGARQLVEKADSFVVEMDTASLNNQEVSVLSLEGEIKDAAGNTLSGIGKSVSDVTVWSTIYSTKTVSFAANYSGEPWSGAVVNSVNFPKSVEIKGPSELLSEISEIESEQIYIDGIYEDYTEDIIPILPEGVMLADASKELKFAVDIAEEGRISFEYDISEINTNNLAEGLSAEYNTKNGEEFITVTVKGPVSTLKTISPADISLNVDGGGFRLTTKEAALSAATQINGLNISLSPSVVGVEVRKY